MGLKSTDKSQVKHFFKLNSANDYRNVPDWMKHQEAFVSHFAEYITARPTYESRKERAVHLQKAFIEYRKYKLTDYQNISDKDLSTEAYDYSSFINDIMGIEENSLLGIKKEIDFPDEEPQDIYDTLDTLIERFEKDFCPRAKEEHSRIIRLNGQRSIEKTSDENKKNKKHIANSLRDNFSIVNHPFIQHQIDGKRQQEALNRFVSLAADTICGSSKDEIVNGFADSLIALRMIHRLDTRPDLSDEELSSDNAEDKEKIASYISGIYDVGLHKKIVSDLMTPSNMNNSVPFFTEVFKNAGATMEAPLSCKAPEHPLSEAERESLKLSEEEIRQRISAQHNRVYKDSENIASVPGGPELAEKFTGEIEASYSKILCSFDKETVINEAVKAVINYKSLLRMGIWDSDKPEDVLNYAVYRNEEDAAAVKEYIEKTYADSWHSDLKSLFSEMFKAEQNANALLTDAGCKLMLTEDEYQKSLSKDELKKEEEEQPSNIEEEEQASNMKEEEQPSDMKEEEQQQEDEEDEELDEELAALEASRVSFYDKFKQTENIKDAFLSRQSSIYYASLSKACKTVDEDNYLEIYDNFLSAVAAAKTIKYYNANPVSQKILSTAPGFVNLIKVALGTASQERCRELQKYLTSEDSFKEFADSMLSKATQLMAESTENKLSDLNSSFDKKKKSLNKAAGKYATVRKSMYNSLKELAAEKDPKKIMELAAKITSDEISTARNTSKINLQIGGEPKKLTAYVGNYLTNNYPADDPFAVQSLKAVLLNEGARPKYVEQVSPSIEKYVKKELKKNSIQEDVKEFKEEAKSKVKEDIKPAQNTEVKEEIKEESPNEISTERKTAIRSVLPDNSNPTLEEYIKNITNHREIDPSLRPVPRKLIKNYKNALIFLKVELGKTDSKLSNDSNPYTQTKEKLAKMVDTFAEMELTENRGKTLYADLYEHLDELSRTAQVYIGEKSKQSSLSSRQQERLEVMAKIQNLSVIARAECGDPINENLNYQLAEKMVHAYAVAQQSFRDSRKSGIRIQTDPNFRQRYIDDLINDPDFNEMINGKENQLLLKDGYKLMKSYVKMKDDKLAKIEKEQKTASKNKSKGKKAEELPAQAIQNDNDFILK